MDLTRSVFSALLIASSGAAAQTPDAEDHEAHDHGGEHAHQEIEEVVVRATPLGRGLDELSQSATVLSGENLYRELANNIGETLTRQAGLANASFGQNVGRPVIRGLQGQRVGHISRILFKTSNHFILIPSTLLLGACLLLLCDIIAQVPFSDLILPINAVTSLFGAPVVIWLILRRKNVSKNFG